LKTFRKLLRDTTSDNTFPDFNWLKNMFILFSLLGLFLLTNLALNTISLDIDRFLRWEVYYIFIAFIIYYLGFVGYKQPDYQKVHIEEPVNPLKISKLSNEKNEEIVKIIEKALQKDKVFLNPTISSQELAKLLELSQSNLSYVVNNSFKKSFRDLINEYRVEEVKSKLNNIDYKHMSILGIALECGFNSEASFYRIFKKNTGVSPKEYIHQKKIA
jgi:AraC-like DNA-binding protein